MLLGILQALLQDHLHSLLKRDLHRIHFLGDAYIHLADIDIWTIFAGTDLYDIAIKFSKFTRQTEQFQGFFKRNGFQTLFSLELRKSRFLLILGTAYLDNRTETPDFNGYRFAGLRVVAQDTFTYAMYVVCIQALFYLWLKILIETAYNLCPF